MSNTPTTTTMKESSARPSSSGLLGLPPALARSRNGSNGGGESPPIPPSPKVGLQLVKCSENEITTEKFTQITTNLTSHSQIRLIWDHTPKNILVVKKPYDATVDQCFLEIINWLHQEKQSNVVVEADAFDEFFEKCPFLQTFGDDTFLSKSSLSEVIDMVISVGGDGTMLHAVSLFPEAVPPIVAFGMGSLGFLTHFDIANFREELEKIFKGDVYLTLRVRLRCRIIRAQQGNANKNLPAPPAQFLLPHCISIPVPPPQPPPLLHLEQPQQQRQQQQQQQQQQQPQQPPPQPTPADTLSYNVLNEVVVDRGNSSFLTEFELYCGGTLITVVQADGLIIGTPTGSTAYSMSAGGTMVHPSVPGILITPICPHSLSFRPIILPDSAVITIKIPPHARSTAMVAFDGKNRQELHAGDSVVITTCKWPVPTISHTDTASEWFISLAKCLHWNVRSRQKPFSKKKQKKRTHDEISLASSSSPSGPATPASASEISNNNTNTNNNSSSSTSNSSANGGESSVSPNNGASQAAAAAATATATPTPTPASNGCSKM